MSDLTSLHTFTIYPFFRGKLGPLTFSLVVIVRVRGSWNTGYALAYDLFLGNTCFKKRDSHLITYRSGNTATQIDFMLFRKSLRKLVMDVKVIPGEEVALQHQLLVCDFMIDAAPN